MKSAANHIKGNDPVSKLYRAVVRYVESRGGTVAVIGGIQVIRMPGAPQFNFTVGISCTGDINEYKLDRPPERKKRATATKRTRREP